MAKSVSARVGTVTRSGHAGQRMHDTREQDLAYVDSERSALNTEPVPVPSVAEMTAECMQRRLDRYDRGELERKPGSIRSDGAIGVRGIITFSAEAQPDIEALSIEEQDRRYVEAAEAIADRLGTTLAGLVVHRDESAPHAHFTLHGYGLDGKPVSKAMNVPALRELQDVVAEPYADMGIRRGKPKKMRIAEGEDPSTYINRTVGELHRDLPAELEAARARRDLAVQEADQAQAEAAELREKLAATQRRLKATEAKLQSAGQATETLRKRAATYKARADKQAARIAALEAQVKLPEPSRIEYVKKPAGRVLGIWPTPAETAKARVYSATKVDKTVRRAYAQRDEAKADHEAEREQRRQLVTRQRKALEPWAVASPKPSTLSLDDLAGPFSERYGVTLSHQPDRVVVPPQEATPKQIAAALYTAGRDAGWDRQWFDVSDEVAAEIVRMAGDDGRLDALDFTRQGSRIGQQRMVEAERDRQAEAQEKAREAAQEAMREAARANRTPSRDNGPKLG